jgi:DNA-binding CsgD family transcriptional regulator
MRALESNQQKPRPLGDANRQTAWPPVTGFIVADASLKPLFANNEAISILTYPGSPAMGIADVFQKKVVPNLFSTHLAQAHKSEGLTTLKLKSGRRSYFCRAFPLNNNGKGPTGAATLVVLERGMSGPVALSQVSRQFNFTQREQQAVALLLQGLSNKEIAESMGISANTVKAFLRMATIKMGAPSRFGIVTKILGLLLFSGNTDRTKPGAIERSSES